MGKWNPIHLDMDCIDLGVVYHSTGEPQFVAKTLKIGAMNDKHDKHWISPVWSMNTRKRFNLS